jgi:fructokinase
VWEQRNHDTVRTAALVTETAALDVLTIGDFLVDMVAPDASHLRSATVFHRTAGGAPANVAVSAARLGARSGFMGAIGADAFGEFLRDTLDKHGVNSEALLSVPQRTTLALVAKNTGGIPDFVFYRGADAAFRPEDVREDLIARSRFLCAGLTSMTVEPERSAVYTAVEMAQRHNVLVCVDPNLRPSSWPSLGDALDTAAPLLAAADILKINDEEARLFTGIQDLEQAVDALDAPQRLLVITLGAEGCLWRRQGEGGRIPAPQIELQDSTGAGDAFLGALLSELSVAGIERDNFTSLAASDLEAALTFACAAGAISCTRVGAMASLPTRAEVEQLLATGNIPTRTLPGPRSGAHRLDE